MLDYMAEMDVQLMMAAMLWLVLYASLATISLARRILLASLGLASLFVAGYAYLRASDAVIGRPVWVEGEVVGMLGGYVQFSHGGKDWFAILIKTDRGPRLIATPYTPGDAQQMQDSMQRLIKLGQGQVIRKRPDGSLSNGDGKGDHRGQGGENSQQGGQLEFYEFNGDFLAPKSDQQAQPGS